MNNNPDDTKVRSRKRAPLFSLAALTLALLLLEGMFRLFGADSAKPSDPRKLAIAHNLGHFVNSLEMFINVSGREGSRSFYIEDPLLMWKLRPNFKGRARDLFTAAQGDEAPEWSFSINKYGFRGSDFEIDREPGVYRIVALGDSSTFGFGVDPGDAYPERLNAELERRCPSCRFEVINLGVPGYSSEQGVALAQEWIAKLKPQAITISYGTNDWWKREHSDADEMARLQTAGAKMGRIARKSALVRGIESFNNRGDAKNPSNKPPLVPRVGIDKYRENIEKIAEFARRAGARVILMDNNFYVPFGTEALVSLAREYSDYALIDGVGILATSLHDIDDLRTKYPQSINIAIRLYSRVIQKRPVFLVMIDPIHPNPVGHQILAVALADEIMNRGGVPDSITEKMRHTMSLPPTQGIGGGFLERTALEMRAFP